MKTKKRSTLPSHRQGEVKVTNAVASIHQILDEIAINGTLNCQMDATVNESTFVFMSDGICATFHIQAFVPIQEGGES